MTKAEKRAVEAYPHDVFQGEIGDSLRAAYMLGYTHAEKDLALIPEDMGVIHQLVRKLQYKYSAVQGCYEEALEMFNKARNEAEHKR